MIIIREELQLTKEQVGNTIIASVAITIIARLLIGWLCERIGPRKAYSYLLVGTSLPVMLVGFVDSYESLLIFRLAIGVIGASFVITQYHTSVMFGPNCIGTANATTAGWGNLGGGVTQMVMPLIFMAFLHVGVSEYWSWRLAMVIPGLALLLAGVAYYLLAQDTPRGNFSELRAKGEMPAGKVSTKAFIAAIGDYRVWALFGIYAACFGVELTINNIAAIYFHDQFSLGLGSAGFIAGLFGLMNIGARTLGGLVSDRTGIKWGLRGRVFFLGTVLAAEGVSLMFFSQINWLPLAIGVLIIFSLFVQMSEGATFSVVPFVNRRALGAVAGVVGAGGNMGAVAAGFLFRAEGASYQLALLILGVVVVASSSLAFFVRFSEADEVVAGQEMVMSLAKRRGAQVSADGVRA